MPSSNNALIRRVRASATPFTATLGTAWTLVFVALSVVAVYPIWRAKHPPLQDLPQHLAAISVLANYPDLNLGQYFELTLGQTQYLTYYLLAQAISYVTGVTLANKLLLCSSLIAIPWSLSALLKQLGRDPRVSVFAFGLTYNAHLVLGFFNFLSAIPLVFWGLVAAIKFRREHTLKRGLILGLLLLVCFYMHVVPFAFLGLGAFVLLVGDDFKRTWQRGLAFIPVTIAAGGWLASTPAGRATLAAAEAAKTVEKPVYITIGQAIRELPTWLTDVLHRERDDEILVAWATLLLLTFAVGLAPRRRKLGAHTPAGSTSLGAGPRAGSAGAAHTFAANESMQAVSAPAALGVASPAVVELSSPVARGLAVASGTPAIAEARVEPERVSAEQLSFDPEDMVVRDGAQNGWLLGLLSPLAFIGYFVLPSAYDWIWPISGRFPLLSLLFLILVIPRMRGIFGNAVLVGAALVATLSFYEINRAFVQFEREEVGDIDAAIATIPKGERVAGLIFGGSSNIVRFAPFLHYVALYQARKGGVVMFTFAEFPQSPFRFKKETRPPPVPPRWEWTPERTDPDRDLTWYRYVLVRGGPGRIQRSPYFENVFQGAGWTVWRRVDA